MTHDTSIALTTAERRLCRIAAVLAAGIWLGAWLLIAILAGPTQHMLDARRGVVTDVQKFGFAVDNPCDEDLIPFSAWWRIIEPAATDSTECAPPTTPEDESPNRTDRDQYPEFYARIQDRYLPKCNIWNLYTAARKNSPAPDAVPDFTTVKTWLQQQPWYTGSGRRAIGPECAPPTSEPEPENEPESIAPDTDSVRRDDVYAAFLRDALDDVPDASPPDPFESVILAIDALHAFADFLSQDIAKASQIYDIITADGEEIPA